MDSRGGHSGGGLESMSAERTMRGGGTPGRTALVQGGVCLIAGLVLVLLAVPRIAAFGIVAPWSGIVPPALQSGASLTEAELLAARESYAAAIAFLPGEAQLQRDHARLSRRISPGDEDVSRGLRAAAAAAPDQGFIWALLADSCVSQSPLRECAGYLRLSGLVAPHEASSMLFRSRLILRHWGDTDDELRAQARRDVRNLWESWTMRRSLARLYLQLDPPRRLLFRSWVLAGENDWKRFMWLAGKFEREQPD